MHLLRHLTSYVVHDAAPLFEALGKISENRARVVFVVSEHGRLVGSLSDGDVRRWLGDRPMPDLSVPVSSVANPAPRSAGHRAGPGEVRRLFGDGVGHVPLVDERGQLVAIAVDGPGVRIGRHVVDEQAPVVVVAEIGINHQGSVDLARELVDHAVDAGADVVKFQLRDLRALYRQGLYRQGLYRQGSSGARDEDLGPQYTLDLLRRFDLGAERLLEVFDHARARDVEVMCTAWDPPSVDVLADYVVDALKVASADLTNHPLLRHMAATALPMVVSTGMATEGEIRDAVDVLRAEGASYSLLHCQSTYPAPYKDLNLRYLTRLAEIGQCPVGYSGHERGHHVPVAAVALGARIVEKHLTTDRDLEGNDHKVSLLPGELAEMVQRIREVEQALGTAAPRAVTPGEAMNRVNLAKSLVAARPVTVGQTIAGEDVAVRSPGRGVQPDALDRLVGRTAVRALEPGDFFYASDLEDAVTTARSYEFRRPWGLPVRYHDLDDLAAASNPDFCEFHFSYADLDLDPADAVGRQRRDLAFACHAPDLYAGDFLLNLASEDDAVRDRSVAELQRVVDTTRTLQPWFDGDAEPVVIASLGGFTRDAHLPAGERARMYERVADGLKRVDDSGVRLCAQTLPPYPWYLGGQLFCNLFVDPHDTADFACTYDRRLVLDVSHTQLAATWLDLPLSDAVAALGPHTEHLHLVDATGVDGEGVQVGEGDVDWRTLAAQLGDLAPRAGFIPEIWQGHVNGGAGFWTALERLERWF